ncbi:MAG: NifB/NifX family molybdenum-iron cluster-binding protein [Phycisphaerae bacterium]
MKIAISASGPGLQSGVDLRFGRASCFVIVDLDNGAVSTSDNAGNQSAAQGAGIQTVKTVVDSGATTVITGNVGPKALAALQAAGIHVLQVAGGSTVQQAVEQFKQGRLNPLR